MRSNLGVKQQTHMCQMLLADDHDERLMLTMQSRLAKASGIQAASPQNAYCCEFSAFSKRAALA